MNYDLFCTFVHMKTGFLIAAPHSGSGKTTIARGLMALYRSKGYVVQPFKCGPDYIDTKFHERVCGRPSVNLDSFFASEDHLRSLFTQYSEGADIAIVEGMMGLFDGYDRDRGSSAEIARILGLPIVLVVDARSAAYSMAALLQGFIQFRPGLAYAGVIFNKVGSERHAAMLRQVCDDLHQPCLGCVPKSAELETGSRYLGLDFNLPQPPPKDGALSPEKICDENINWELIVRSTCNNVEDNLNVVHAPSLGEGRGRFIIARNDEAFSFLYQETIDRLSSLGNVEYFDPEANSPSSILNFQSSILNSPSSILNPQSSILNPQSSILHSQLLYLPGGYPEKHLEALVKAEHTRRAIREYAEQGGRIIAECGGMMYLCQSIVTDEGEYPMCGVLPYKISARKADRHLSLGYRSFTLDGRECRGHEFHYTQVMGGTWQTDNREVQLIPVFNAQGNRVETPVLRYKNVVASYTHLYNVTDVLRA